MNIYKLHSKPETLNNYKQISKLRDIVISSKDNYSATIEYKNLLGDLHREDGPALEYEDGREAWYYDGVPHRGGDLPASIDPDGDMEWWVHGKQHREGGPAIVYDNGMEYWMYNDELHREDGPAVTDNETYFRYYIHNKEYSKEEYNAMNK